MDEPRCDCCFPGISGLGRLRASGICWRVAVWLCVVPCGIMLCYVQLIRRDSHPHAYSPCLQLSSWSQWLVDFARTSSSGARPFALVAPIPPLPVAVISPTSRPDAPHDDLALTAQTPTHPPTPPAHPPSTPSSRSPPGHPLGPASQLDLFRSCLRLYLYSRSQAPYC